MMYPLVGLLLASTLARFTEALNLTVGSGPGNASSPLLYGILFEVHYSFEIVRKTVFNCD